MMKTYLKSFSIVILGFMIAILFQNCGTGFSQDSLDDSGFSSALSSLDQDENFFFQKKPDSRVTFKNPVFADSSSVVMVVGPGSKGNLFRISSDLNFEEAVITIDKGMLNIYHISKAEHYTIAQIPLEVNQKTVIAAYFGRNPLDMKLLINGRLQNLSIKTVGNPYAYSYLFKQYPVIDTSANVLAAKAYSTALSEYELSVLSTNLGVEFGVIGITHDANLTRQRPGIIEFESAEFKAAKAVIDAKCLACHDSANNGNFRGLSQSQYIQKGLIVPKNPAASKIYYRLRGAKSGPGPMNMPPLEEIGAQQVTVIETWINSISN